MSKKTTPSAALLLAQTPLTKLVRLRVAIKRHKYVYTVCAFSLVTWHALLQWASQLATYLRGSETLLGIDLLPCPEPEKETFEFTLVACLRFKNEAPYLREWIEYHQMVGIQHFILYNNNSDDDYLSVLRPYIDRKLVTLKDWPAIPPSPSAELDCVATYRKRARWIAFIDADEFIVPTKGTGLLDVLEELSPQTGLAINWRYFGSNFHHTKPFGLVTASYTKCNARLDRHVKSIVNPRRIIKYGNPHFWYYANARLATNEGRKSVLGSFCWRPSDTLLVIHHYVHKSAEEFLAKARLNSRADPTSIQLRTRREDALERAFPQHNEVVNDSMARFSSELARRCLL